jgi:hypothetical protein
MFSECSIVHPQLPNLSKVFSHKVYKFYFRKTFISYIPVGVGKTFWRPDV